MRHFVTSTLQRASIICIVVLLTLFSTGPFLAYAANPSCPAGTSALDCEAVLNGWTAWVPNSCFGSTALNGADNEQKAFNFFVSQGLTAIQSAGIIGNLMQESGVNPNAVQSGNGLGRGIAQWSVGGRWDSAASDNVVWFATSSFNTSGSNDKYDLGVQLNFIWYELTHIAPYQAVLKNLKAATTVPNAVNEFVGPNDLSGNPVPPTDEVQRSGGYENPGSPQMTNRINYANTALSQYGGSTAGAGNACSFQCNNGSTVTGNSALSPTRQKVVCLANQELATWKQLTANQRPPYGNPPAFIKYTDGWECNDPPPNPPPNGSCGKDGTQEWCADFVSWLYKQAGYPFTGGSSGGWRLAAVWQIQDIGQSNQQFHIHLASGYTPKPGDLALHGYPSYNAQGEDVGLYHVNIVVAVSGRNVTYVGGDQGSGPYGGPNSASVVSSYTSNHDDVYYYVSPD